MKKIVGVFVGVFSTALFAQSVLFNAGWNGLVEQQLKTFLSAGMAGPDGSNGQAVVNAMNALGGIYANAEFQPHHNGPTGLPTYGFGWFYVSYVPLSAQQHDIPDDGSGRSFYQLVEFAAPPPGDGGTPPNPTPQPPPVVVTVDQGSVLQAISALSTQLEAVHQDLSAQAERVFANLTAQVTVVSGQANAINAKVQTLAPAPPAGPSAMGAIGSGIWNVISSPAFLGAAGAVTTCVISGKC